MSLGLLHTSPAHVAPFDALLRRVAPGRTAVHALDEELLRRARSDGPEPVRADVARAVRELAARGADVVLCTCSTLGAVAESLAEMVPVPVLRVDRPAAVRAAELARTHGGAVGAVVSLPSTAGPTRELLAQVTEGAVEVILAEGAWARFESGDADGHLRLVEHTARGLASRVAVVLLAQVSMAEVAARLGDLDVPVLTTPGPAVEAAVRLARGR